MQNARLRNRLRKFILFFIILFISELLPHAAVADGIKGYLELNYSHFDSTSSSSGGTSQTRTSSFNQLYNINLMRSIYPNLTLKADAIFEKTKTKLSGDSDTESATTRIRPLIELNLRTPLFNAGVGYSRNQKKESSGGSPGVTNVLEDYNASFGWRPEDFPSIEIRMGKANLFDSKRLIQDIQTDSVMLNIRYEPLKDLEIRYQPSYRNTKDKLNEIDKKTMDHTGRVTYSALLFNKRVSLLTSYNIAHNETTITTAGSAGEVSFQVFPVAGLSAVDDNPVQDLLVPNSALIDGDLTSVAGLNIGLPAGVDISPRNAGVDLSNPTEVNTLYIFVQRELPGQIAGSFSWNIYTSSDNQNWNLLTTVFPASFGPFQNRFEIKLPNVTTRYIKAVTSPLKLANTIGVTGDFSDIFITEVQAFIRKTTSDVRNEETVSTTTYIYNVDIRTRILDAPSLFHELAYFLSTTDPSSLKRSTLSNGLSLSHRFSSIFSGNARVAREDISDTESKGHNYIYSASVNAVPLKTLSHTLTYSGQSETIDGETSKRSSVFLNNIAELYKGININVADGISFQTSGDGEKQESNTILVGSSIIPHPKLNLNLNYSMTKSKFTGSSPKPTTSTGKKDLSVAYKPFETLFLSFSVSKISGADKTSTIQNYAMTWSPFREGTLQFNLAFNEALTSDEGKSRIIGPSLRWNISRNMYLDMAYQIFKSDSESQTSDTKTSSASFRMVF
ncbi:MAG: hypothetical protein HY758_11605 [Nitrospirae bacterium]|nr:hypothetical protein [Nitrospirota bacterium]